MDDPEVGTDSQGRPVKTTFTDAELAAASGDVWDIADNLCRLKDGRVVVPLPDGYYDAKTRRPVPAEEIPDWIRNWNPDTEASLRANRPPTS